MLIKQVSVFIENRPGRLLAITKVLTDNGINIVSLSLADTSEYGLLRLIVSDPEGARVVLMENGFSAMLTDVLAVRLPNGVGKLQELLAVITEKEQSIEYMYILATGGGNDSMIIKSSDPVHASQALMDGGFQLYTPEEAYHIV